MMRYLFLTLLSAAFIGQFFIDSGVKRILFDDSNPGSIIECTIIEVVGQSQRNEEVDKYNYTGNNNKDTFLACISDPDDFVRTISGPNLEKHNSTLVRGARVRFADVLVTMSKIIFSEGSKIEIVKQEPDSSSRLASISSSSSRRGRRLQSLEIETTGTRRILVIRVTTSDGAVSYDSATISDKVFGTNGNTNTPTALYQDCSFGQLDFQPSTADGAVNGVIEVTVDLPTPKSSNNVSNFDIMNEAWLQLPGTVSYPDHHLLFALPKSTVNYKYFGFYSALRSIFNDEYITSPIAVAQALALNFGVHRSLSSSYEPFGDLSDYMSLQDYETDLNAYHKMCFNAVKNYQFGWYSARSIDVDITTQSWTGTLVATADYDQAAAGEYVLIKLGFFYIQYNKKKGIIAEIQEHGDTIAAYVYSEPISISAFQLNNAGTDAIASGDTIEICSMSTTPAGVDFAVVSIHNFANGQVSLC